jgi:hypothetical protein
VQQRHTMSPFLPPSLLNISRGMPLFPPLDETTTRSEVTVHRAALRVIVGPALCTVLPKSSDSGPEALQFTHQSFLTCLFAGLVALRPAGTPKPWLDLCSDLSFHRSVGTA